MSSSYFDAQPAKAPPPSAVLDIPKDSELAKLNLLTPQISRILDDVDLEEKSSSEDDNASLSGESDPDKGTSGDRKSRRDLSEQDNSIRKSQTSPLPRGSKRVQVQNPPPSHRPGLKHPHFARFHSLRSMLFSSNIEDKMQKYHDAQQQEQAEAKWKAEHDLRRGLNRPRTPESQSPPKEGLATRVKGGLKRMTSKDSPPPMAKIPEDNVSTASDDEEEEANHSNKEDINHSDIEELVRWVSRRDPPSDGEARKLQEEDEEKQDSGHESLGHSDVDELVRWVSRKDEPQSKVSSKTKSKPKPKPKPRAKEPPKDESKPKAETEQHGYSDASTESDSEGAPHPTKQRESMDEDDIDELVRWVSRRDGPSAGPVRKKKEGSSTSTSSPSGSEQDQHTEELVRWVTKKDEISGESENASRESLPMVPEHVQEPKAAPIAGSRLKTEVTNTKPAAMESDTALTHDDVDELVQWVSRKNPNVQEVEEGDDDILKWKEEQDSAQKLT